MRRPWQEPRLERAPGFEQFVRARSPRLLAVARGLSRSDTGAEKLVEEVLAKALLDWDAISAAPDPGAQVNRMLVKAATSFRRRHFRRETPTGQDALLRTLATLRPRQRAVLVLRYYEGLNDHEIAATLGLSHASVRSNTTRGLETLRTAGLLNRTRV